MKPLVALSVSLLVVGCVRAHTLDAVIIAAMKLSEEPNYSWTCNITDDAGSYQIEGKTIKGGYTWQRQPMPKVIARRLGRGASYDLEAIFTTPSRYVIKTDNGWKRLDELPKQHPDWIDQSEAYRVSTPIIRGPEMPADPRDSDPFGLPRTVYVQIPRAGNESDDVYSNAQFALDLPHEQLGVIVSSGEFQIEGDTASGTLTDLGAQLLLVHDGHEYIKPVTAAGRFKLWLSHGRVVKYNIELAGVVLVDRDRKTVYVRQTSTTQVRDVGTTTVSLPAEARRKL